MVKTYLFFYARRIIFVDFFFKRRGRQKFRCPEKLTYLVTPLRFKVFSSSTQNLHFEDHPQYPHVVKIFPEWEWEWE